MTPAKLRRKIANRLRRLSNAEAVRRDLPAPVAESESRTVSAEFTLLGETDYRALLRIEPEHLYLLGGRMQSPDAVDLLARGGTNGRLDWNALSEFLRTSRSALFPGNWHLRPLLYAALLNMVIHPGEESLRITARATRLAARHHEIGESLREYRLWMMCLGSAILTEDSALLDDLYRVHAPDRNIAWAGRTDHARPELRTEWDEERVSPWWHALNEPFSDLGLEPWGLDGAQPLGEESIFTRIRAPHAPGCAIPRDQQPLVTVIVPCYRPTSSFANTIESLTRQSWANIEVLIVDDASPDGAEHLAAAEMSDDRVRVIRLRENGGAYVARNTGLREARGAFVTFLDADDLSHSRRVEFQMLPLLDDPSLMATLSRSLRLTADGAVTQFGTPPTRLNLSSILFRRAEVLAAIGPYDEVRKAADSEFRERIEAWRGRESVYQVPAALSLVQLTTGSLSRGDFRVDSDWFAGVRIAYRDQYRGWHRRIVQHPERELPLADGAPACVAPAPLRGRALRAHFDVAYLGDWQEGVADTGSWVSAIVDRRLATGAAVGLLRGVHPRLSSRYRSVRLSQQVWQCVESGEAEWISWAQESTIDTLVVTDPEYLVLLPTAAAVGLRVRRVVVAVEHGIGDARGAAGATGVPDPVMLASRCEQALGVRPEWHAGSRGILAALSDPSAQSGRTIIGSPRFSGPAPGSAGPLGNSPRILVGVTPLRVAAPAELIRDWVPAPDRASVVILDEFTLIGAYEREQLPPNVRILDIDVPSVGAANDGPDTRTPRTVIDLVERADVLLFDPLDRREEPLDRLWSALTRGAVVVAPASYLAELGDLIVPFASTTELASTLLELSGEPGVATRAIQRARVSATLASEFIVR
ncbi:glycosyltransferase family A protein [Leucobacter sp. NPDC077196]|uniref:glycosyltransferase family 2 protein n=1 Tax=Leucobacter sp. NPDC077196 TaxID=3154959 RepID=UPI0034439996